MKSLLKSIMLVFVLSSLSVFAQTNQQTRPSANQDSTSIGGIPNTTISAQPSNANSAVVAPMYCQARNLSWTVGTATCSGIASQTGENASRTVISNSANTGSATYTCSNNSFINERSTTCMPTAPVQCDKPWQPSMSQTMNPCIPEMLECSSRGGNWTQVNTTPRSIGYCSR